MLGRGSATATDQARPGLDEALGILGHVLGASEIELAPFVGPGQASVGLNQDRLVGHRDHALQRLEHGTGADRAVDANDVRSPLLEAGGEDLGRGAEQRVAVGVDGHAGDDGQVGSDLARGEDRLAHDREITEGLDQEDVDATLDQTTHLLGEHRAGLVEAGRAKGFDAQPERANAAGHVAPIAGSLPGDLGTAPVDGVELVVGAMLAQLVTIGPKGIAGQHLCARLAIGLVDLPDDFFSAEIEGVVALVEEEPAVIELGTDATVHEDDAGLVEKFDEGKTLAGNGGVG